MPRFGIQDYDAKVWHTDLAYRAVCERAMMELPAQYTLPRKRKSPLMKFQDFVDNFYSINNDMQELHSMCRLLSIYVDRVVFVAG